jgi:hypothetical protein
MDEKQKGYAEVVEKLIDLGGGRGTVEVKPGLFVFKGNPPPIWDVDYYAPTAWIPRKESEEPEEAPPETV